MVFTLHDPISNKKHIIDFDEMRVQIDSSNFKENFENISNNQTMFNQLDGFKKEDVLSFIKVNEEKEPIISEQMKAILLEHGLDIKLQILVKHVGKKAEFHDKTKQKVKDRIFFADESRLAGALSPTLIRVDEAVFQTQSEVVVSDDFYTTIDYGLEESFPIFDKGISNGTEFQDKFFINPKGDLEPVFLRLPLFSEDAWEYYLEVEFALAVPEDFLLWRKVPKIKHLFNFFEERGYIAKEEPHKTTFVHPELLNYFEYYSPYQHLMPPFLILKAVEADVSVEGRVDFGKTIQKLMDKTELTDSIVYYRAFLKVEEALSKLKNKKKHQPETLLIEAVNEFEKIHGERRYQAQLDIIFCNWVRNRIGEYVNDEVLMIHTYEDILSRFAEMHMWESFVWLLQVVDEIDKKRSEAIVKKFLPVAEIDKYYLMSKETYYTLIGYWVGFSRKDVKPPKKHLAKALYERAKQAKQIGLQEEARDYLVEFFRVARRNPEFVEWAKEGTEELFDFATSLGAHKEYRLFCNQMVKHLQKQYGSTGLGEMETIRRKEFRWTLHLLKMAQSRWAFHSGYIDYKENPDKIERVREMYLLAYNSLEEGLYHIDLTEEYTEEQLLTIAQGILNGIRLGYAIKSKELIMELSEKALEVWNLSKTKEMYLIIQSIFTKEQRLVMAADLTKIMIDSVVAEYGKFTLNKETIFTASELYLSIEDWESCSQTILYGLDNIEWDFDELNDLFITYHALKKYAPQEASKLNESIYRWIQNIKNKTEAVNDYELGTRRKIQHLLGL